jgi:hypothetical protein
MPRITHEQKALYKSKIRSVLARNHQISAVELAEVLKTGGLDLERHYLGKLMKEVNAERVRRADRQTLNFALASFEDTMTEVVRVAWEIANTPYISAQARVMALKEVREAHKDVFEKLFDAGVFNRKLGEIDLTVRNVPLSDERKKSIREVFDKWGLLAAPAEAPPKEDAGTPAPSPQDPA